MRSRGGLQHLQSQASVSCQDLHVSGRGQASFENSGRPQKLSFSNYLIPSLQRSRVPSFARSCSHPVVFSINKFVSSVVSVSLP